MLYGRKLTNQQIAKENEKAKQAIAEKNSKSTADRIAEIEAKYGIKK